MNFSKKPTKHNDEVIEQEVMMDENPGTDG
jgi:hypothetical protein